MATKAKNPEKELRDTFRAAYRKFNAELGALRGAAKNEAEHEKLDQIRLEFAAVEWELRRTELDAAATGFATLSADAVKLGDKVAKDVATWKSIKAASEAITAFFGLLSRVIVNFRI